MAPRMDTKETSVQMRLDNVLNIYYFRFQRKPIIIKILSWEGGGGLFNEHEEFSF